MYSRTVLVGVALMLATITPVSAQVPNFTRVAGDFPVDGSPLAGAADDFNHDQKVDLAVANNDTDDVSVLFGNGDGTFLDSGATFQLGADGQAPSAIAIGDFNHDGNPDIITANEIGSIENGSTVTVLLGSGSTTFGEAKATVTGNSPEAVVVGNFDGDGNLDAATADNFDDTVTILHGNGDGTFTIAQVVALTPGASPTGLAVADLDNDGTLDLVVANNSGGPDATGSINVLKGTASGFVLQPEMSAGFNLNVPVAVTVGDLNHDGNKDLVVVNEDGDSVSILLGTGNLTFTAANPATTSVGGLPESAAIDDFNGDGKLDIATSASLDDKVAVLAGNGDGTFVPAQSFDVASGPFGMVTADFNGDHKPDLASVNVEGGNVSVLLNVTSSVVPTPTPGVVCVGDCDTSTQVTVNEIITMVNIALGNGQATDCMAGDANHDGQITVDEIISAINNALNGCTQ